MSIVLTKIHWNVQNLQRWYWVSLDTLIVWGVCGAFPHLGERGVPCPHNVIYQFHGNKALDRKNYTEQNYREITLP